MMRRDRPPAFISSPARMKKGTASSGKLSKPACRFCASSCESKRSEEHTSELQSRLHLVCRLLLEKKKKHNRRKDYAVGNGHPKLHTIRPREHHRASLNDTRQSVGVYISQLYLDAELSARHVVLT